MKVFTIGNEKGGVGKTTVAVTSAAGLAARGHSVLLIDADAQGHSTIGTGLAKYPGLYDFMVRNADYKDVIRGIPAEKFAVTAHHPGRLAVLGSNIETRSIASVLESNAYVLADRLEPLAAVFDVVIVDTSPTPSLLHGLIYLATDILIYPTLLESWSFDGLQESFRHREAAQNRKPIPIGGVIPMKCRHSTLEHRDNLALLNEGFGDLVWPAMADRIIWTEAAREKLPVFVYAPNSEAAIDSWEIVDRLEALLNG